MRTGSLLTRPIRKDALAVSTAGALCQKRYFEYWQHGVGPKTQPYCRGDMLDKLVQPFGFPANNSNPKNAESYYMTGSPAHAVYDDETMYNAEAEMRVQRKRMKMWVGVDKFILPPLNAEYGPRVAALINGLTEGQKDSIFESLFKDYPNVRKPFQPDVQAEWITHWGKLAEIAHDEEACKAAADAFVLKNAQERFLTFEWYTRFAEKLMAELIQLPGVRSFETRMIKLVVEQIMKIQQNLFADHPWACDDVTSAFHMPVCGFRPYHETGHW
jgi:hypothetical protein